MIAGVADVGLTLLPGKFGLQSMVLDIMRTMMELFTSTPAENANELIRKQKRFDVDMQELYKTRTYVPPKSYKVEEVIGDWTESTFSEIEESESAANEAAKRARDASDSFDELLRPSTRSINLIDDDIDEFVVVSVFHRAVAKAKFVWQEYRGRIALFVIASIFGMTLYLIVHKRKMVMVWLGLTDAPVLEGKGKTKGRAQDGRGKGHASGNKKHRRDYIIYDDDNIVELVLDGNYITPRDYFGKKLPNGEYVIIRSLGFDERGRERYTEETVIVDDEYEPRGRLEADPKLEKVFKDHKEEVWKIRVGCNVCGKQYVHTLSRTEFGDVLMDECQEYLEHVHDCMNSYRERILREPSKEPTLYCGNCNKCFRGKDVISRFSEHNETCCMYCRVPHEPGVKDCGKRVRDEVPDRSIAPKVVAKEVVKNEALVPGSPTFKLDVIRQCVGQVLDKDGGVLQNQDRKSVV